MTSKWDQERALVPISAIEHWSYCPRQCGLIHIERTFDENLYTIRGQLAHERVDNADSRSEDGVAVLRAIPLWSDRLALTGRADVVELRAEGPYPVEYKAGPPVGPHAALQLCAQALCLEEMMGGVVRRGATFHVATRRRQEVEFDSRLRRDVESIVEDIRAMLDRLVLPPPVSDGRCRHCSLVESCQPAVLVDTPGTAAWDAWLFRGAEGEGES